MLTAAQRKEVVSLAARIASGSDADGLPLLRMMADLAVRVAAMREEGAVPLVLQEGTVWSGDHRVRLRFVAEIEFPGGAR